MNPKRAFTLVELLVVMAIIGVMAIGVAASWPTMRTTAQRTVSLSNMRAIGAAFHLYTADHDSALPGRVTGKNADGTKVDRWPKLLSAYLDGTKVYAAIGDTNNFIAKHADPLSNTRNNTSYIMNGYNDVGAFTNQNVAVHLSQISDPNEVLLLGSPNSGSHQYYMDFLEGPNGNQNDVLNLKLYGDGSDYLFTDGSAKFIRASDYADTLWLVNKSYSIPAIHRKSKG